ncbi:uncharacterized protein F5147DRAFT_566538 [Suillus discolor]|uniref:Uncharacterized protein n=1 Tax=Suillus discolor TaxID=1912936 RepID=A0A9P7K033_9AGAM|nr:uncharacterized protein F5147DRAFT_566538 [Suillus discolor]KAG2118116.1 hypothetical protein F5147DRAFT_566538 [Suillus discolor]
MTTEHSHVSGNPYSLQPGQWAPPRAPLPPHRLAKIANALGVSMPSPAGPNSSSSYLSASFPGASPTISHTDLPWRVTTPSTASTHHVGSFASSSQSKFLLHVIPPLHLLHDFDASDPLEPAPPPNASGYHTQFRRGTLVSLQPSLHAQLNAIAKEYALPSTIGLILYLITTSPQSRQNSPMPYATPNSGNEDAEEPGPRISEEIWKHIWGRVLKAEREESLALSRGQGSSPFGLGQPNLRPLVTPTRTETPQPQPITYPITPSSTTSSVSDLRSHSKSTPLSSSSLTHSEPDTPDTSHSSDHEILGIGLPGLNSPSIIPILAKVEFDIDRRRAAWYEPWLRGRRMTHAKRAESRQSNQPHSQPHAEGDGDEKRVPFDLKLVERMQNASSVPSFTASLSSREEGGTSGHDGYTPLADPTDEEVDENITTCETDICHHDPLADIFGSDADTWAEMRAESQGNQPEINPNIVELALDVSSIAAMPEQEQAGDEVDDAQEVWDIMRRMSKPTLTLSIPSSPSSQQLSSPPAGSAKKSPPCPLILAPNDTRNSLVLHTGPSPILSSSSRDDSMNLPYEHASSRGTPVSSPLAGETGDDDELSLDMDQEYMRSRSPEEKRGGAVFEDLNLGLDLGDDEDEEYDENDPNDQRRSQYLMRAKLDEIERTLAQFSPRHIKTDDLDQDITITHARTKSLLALHAEGTSKLSVDRTRDFQATGNSIDHADTSDKSWPAISYSSITNNSSQSPSSQSHRPSNLTPSPPQLAINGVSTGAPKSFAPPSRSSSPNTLSTETKIRKRDLEPSMYPTPLPPSFGRLSDTATDSPIPLSPDPFGRYPSYLESEAHSTPTYWDPATGQFTSIPVESRPSLSSVDEGSVASTTPSSRFSADSESFSMDAVTAKTSTPLVSVKTFKRLWRRSKSASVSAQQPPTPNRTSFQGFVPPSSSLHDQLGPSPPPQKGLPPVPVTAMPRTPTRPSSPTTPSSEKTSVRKSILKTWKSVSGSTASSSAPSEPRRDTERPVSNETIKPRRPSVLDAGIPPTPKLAEQYLPSNHARTGSGIFERRRSVGRSKMGASSNLSTSFQDFALPSRTHSRTSSSLQQTSSPLPPSSSVSPAPPRHSKVDSSFESAQYELVSSSPRLYPNLSYPYQTLDQD